MAPGGGDGSVRGPGPLPDVLSEITACGGSWRPSATETVAAAYDGLEDFRARRVLVYADATDARADLDALVTLRAACPEERRDGGAINTEVLAGTLAEEATTFLSTYSTDGLPVVGQSQLHVLRAGRALVLASVSDESPGHTDLDAARARVRRSELEQAALVATVCAEHTACCRTAQVLTPRGYGRVRLGMRRTRLTALPAVVVDRDAGTTCVLATFPGGEAVVSPTAGDRVVAMTVEAPTDLGVGPGSTARALRDAYPDGVTTGGGRTFTVPLGDGVVYQFGLTPDRTRLASVTLLDTERFDCGA